MRVLARWTHVPNQIDSEALHLLLPIYDIASETIRIESLVQELGAHEEIALA